MKTKTADGQKTNHANQHTTGPPKTKASGPVTDFSQEIKRLPAAPVWLDEIASAFWARIGKGLVSEGRLTKQDLPALESLCACWSDMQRAEQAIRDHGVLIEGDNRGFKKNPATAIMKSARGDLLSYLKEFGLTPGVRIKMEFAAPKKDEYDPFKDHY